MFKQPLLIVLLVACSCLDRKLEAIQSVEESSRYTEMGTQGNENIILYADKSQQQQCTKNEEIKFEYYANGFGGFLKVESEDTYFIKTYYDGDRPENSEFIAESEHVLTLYKSYFYTFVRCSDSKMFTITIFSGRPQLAESVAQKYQKQLSDFNYFSFELNDVDKMKTLIVQSVVDNKESIKLRLGKNHYFSGLQNDPATNAAGSNFIVQNKGNTQIDNKYILEIQSTTGGSVMYAKVDSDVAYLAPNQYSNIKKELSKYTTTYYYTEYTEKEYHLLIFTENTVKVEFILFQDDLIGAIKQNKIQYSEQTTYSQTIKLSSDILQDNCLITQNCRMLIKLTNLSSKTELDIELRIETGDNSKELLPGVLFKDLLKLRDVSKYEFKLQDQAKTLQVKITQGTINIQLNEKFSENENRLSSSNFYNEVISTNHNFDVESSRNGSDQPFNLRVTCQSKQCQYSLNLISTPIDDNDDGHFTLWWLVILAATVVVGIIWAVANHFYKKRQVQPQAGDQYTSMP